MENVTPREMLVNDEQFSIKHVNAETVEYTLYMPNQAVDQTIVFYPGVACNRFGHPVDKEPKHAVADLVGLAANNYNIIFPEVHMPESLGDTAPISGLTIDEQNQRVAEVLFHARQKIELGQVTYMGQSLGCLAVAQLVKCGIEMESERTIFWGPPTLEGKDHREMLISKFIRKPETRVNLEGEGQLQLGGGRLMHVTRDFWESLDENSIRAHYESMIEHYESVVAICASRDNFYPNNKQYLAEYAPAVQRMEIEGTNHLFRPVTMREQLRHFMARLL